MSSLQRYFPSNQLAAALSKATPRTMRECLNQANENLRHIAAACLAHVDNGLDLLEATLASWPDSKKPEYLQDLYQLSLRLIGAGTVAGLPHVDRAARSLCDVLDGLITRDLWEKGPIEVHVASMRLLRDPAALGAGAEAIVEGLQLVRARFAVEPPPSPMKPKQA
jgi:hypothetical protein